MEHDFLNGANFEPLDQQHMRRRVPQAL